MICPRGTRPSIPCPQVTGDISIPLHAPLYVAVVAAPAQVAVLHAVGVGIRPFDRRCCPRAAPRGRVAPPCAGAAPAGDRSCQRPPLQAAALAAGLPLAAWSRVLPTPAGTASVGANHARGRSCLLVATPCRLADPARGFWPWPSTRLQGALAAVGCPLQPADRGHGGWPWLAAPPPRCSCCECIGGVSLQRSIVWVPLERRTFDLLHSPSRSGIQGYTISLGKINLSRFVVFLFLRLFSRRPAPMQGWPPMAWPRPRPTLKGRSPAGAAPVGTTGYGQPARAVVSRSVALAKGQAAGWQACKGGCRLRRGSDDGGGAVMVKEG
ncbi:hypothetical protein GW17_00034338 [Ensete ventricosum]|nr:hypothetical protein GW17_00034338 [Ensete ventricosum]